jgi:hypothetical protein
LTYRGSFVRLLAPLWIVDRSVGRATIEIAVLAFRFAAFAYRGASVSITWITLAAHGLFPFASTTLRGSGLPDELRKAGYELVAEEPGERILAAAVTERFTRNADGTLSMLTGGSTRPVALVRHHAGITKTERYSFSFADYGRP